MGGVSPVEGKVLPSDLARLRHRGDRSHCVSVRVCARTRVRVYVCMCELKKNHSQNKKKTVRKNTCSPYDGISIFIEEPT